MVSHSAGTVYHVRGCVLAIALPTEQHDPPSKLRVPPQSFSAGAGHEDDMTQHEMRPDCKVIFEGIEKGLTGLRTDVQAQTKAGEDWHAQVMRTLHGYEDHPGFGGRIASLEGSRKWVRRLGWMLITATVGLITGGVLLWLRILWT